MHKKKKKKVMSREFWTRDPVERPHSTRKGNRGHRRKKINKKDLGYLKEDLNKLDYLFEDELYN